MDCTGRITLHRAIPNGEDLHLCNSNETFTIFWLNISNQIFLLSFSNCLILFKISENLCRKICYTQYVQSSDRLSGFIISVKAFGLNRPYFGKVLLLDDEKCGTEA